MSLIPLSLTIYVVALVVLVGPVAWKWRKRASWNALEILNALASFVLWVGFLFMGRAGKSMGNLVAEPFLLAVLVALISWLRVALAPALDPSRAAGFAGLLALAAAWFVWWAVPGLPE